jgi:hypothetical protein
VRGFESGRAHFLGGFTTFWMGRCEVGKCEIKVLSTSVEADAVRSDLQLS